MTHSWSKNIRWWAPLAWCLVLLIQPAMAADVQQLEAEIQKLLQRYTEQHPDVVFLKRDLALARERERKERQKAMQLLKEEERRHQERKQQAMQLLEQEERRYRKRNPQAPDSAAREPHGNPVKSKQRKTAESSPTPVAPATVELKVAEFQHPGGLHTGRQLQRARERLAAGMQAQVKALEDIKLLVAKGLRKPPQAIAVLDIPGYYPAPDLHRENSRRINSDSRNAYACAVVYQVVDTSLATLCAEKTMNILMAWATTNKEVAGQDGHLTMTYAGLGMVFAAELIADFDGWTAEQREAFRNWVRQVYLRSARNVSSSENNKGSWGLLGRISAHHFLGDRKAMLEDVDRIKHMIEVQIAEDGYMPAEVARGANGLWYTYFSLAPLTAAAEVAYNALGVDLYRFRGQDGVGLRDALDLLFEHAVLQVPWPYSSKVKLNGSSSASWPYNLFDAMSAAYQDPDYERGVERFRPFTNVHHHFAWSFPTLLRPDR